MPADAKQEALTRAWSFSTGERGVNKVRAFTHPKTGTLYLEFSERGAVQTGARTRPKVVRVALGHRDREQAKAKAEELSAKLRLNERPTPAQLTLGALFDNYLSEVTPAKGVSKQRHDARCAELFRRAFGAAREARSLSRREWDRFIRERRSGVLRPAGVKTKRTVGDRIVGYDLRWLLAVLTWATMAGDGRGGVLLERNPLKGLDVPEETSPKRPRLTADDYAQLAAVAGQVSPLFRLALVLAHETGHRIGAIRQLRWSDVSFERKTITWRATTDKLHFEHTTPLTTEAVAALELEYARVTRDRARTSTIGDGWVLAHPADVAEPVTRDALQDWWTRAETMAKLAPVARRGWHSLRRQFATELKHTPLKDLCALGGWKAPETILRCYQQPDEDTMREALERRPRIKQAGQS